MGAAYAVRPWGDPAGWAGALAWPSYLALVPVLATLGWRTDEIELRPIWPSVNKTMWLYTRTYEPLSMLAGLLLGRVREALDEINDKYRPDPEAISELPPLPVF